MRAVPCVFIRNFETVPRRTIMCLSDYPNMFTATKMGCMSIGEKKKKLDLYEFMVRFPGSTADVLRLTLLSPHVHGYAGEKNTWVSHMSKTATASIITLPAIYTYKHVQ